MKEASIPEWDRGTVAWEDFTIHKREDGFVPFVPHWFLGGLVWFYLYILFLWHSLGLEKCSNLRVYAFMCS